MKSFDETIASMAIYLNQVDDTLLLIGVTDDTVLREHVVKELRQHLSSEITLREFRYDPEHISLLEGAQAAAASANGQRVAVSVTGLETLTRDKQSEAIKLLNSQRNRFGHTRLAVIFWVNRALLAEVANKAADFYSWRSHTFIIEPPPDWDTLASARRSYLQALIYQNQYVSLQGLAPMRGGQIVQMRMDEIFIPLHAEQEVVTYNEPRYSDPRYSDPKVIEWFKNLDTELPPSEVREPNIQIQELFSQSTNLESDWVKMTEARKPYWESYALRFQRQVISRPIKIPELMQERRAIVLGDPGAGKTTLLRYAAYRLAQAQIEGASLDFTDQNKHLAECLPVYIRIGLYAQHLQQHGEMAFDDYAPLGCQLFQLPLSAELLKSEMQQGRVLFLLDGLDEIIDTTQRRAVAQRVEAFAHAHPNCPMIVTSRIVGYREARLSGEFGQFTISPFADQEIRRFAESWYQALKMPDHANALVNAILGNDSIRRLASNPLLLTVIALIHYRGTKLPHHRVKLYHLAAETLVDQWMSARRVTPEDWNAPETVDVLLPAIAWRLHETTSSGLIGQQDLHELLVETLRQQDPRLSESEAHTRASQFRRNVAEFSGIFLERGLDQDGRGIYGFLHLTFEEYFAAVRLADKWEREGDQTLKPLLHNPRWTETILLTAGRFGETSQYSATKFVRAILTAKSEYEEILHRDLLLAARCLADDVRVDVDLRHAILGDLLKLYFGRQSPPALRDDIRQAFARLGGTNIQAELVDKLVERTSSAEASVRYASASALEQMGQTATSSEVIAAVIKLLADDEGDVRAVAARALGQMGQAAASPEVIPSLLKLLGDDEWNVREAAARALGQIGQTATSPEVIPILLKLLADEDWKVRSAAINALGQIGQAVASPEALSLLLKLLADTEVYVRYEATHALGRIRQAAALPEVIYALLKLLSADDWNVRDAAASALGQIGQAAASPEVISALLRLLTDAERNVRAAAARTLGQIGQATASSEVISALLNLLSEAEVHVRCEATRALGQIGQAAASPEVISALLKLLSEANGSVRSSAAHALGQIGQTPVSTELTSTLLKLLSDDKWHRRGAAASALGQIGQAAPSPEVISALLKLLSDDEVHVRSTTAHALGQIGQAAASPEVISALLKLLSDDDWNVRDLASHALTSLSSLVRAHDLALALKLFLPFARDKKNAQKREAGYIGLRNLLAAEPQ